jgi:hypothetical protein
LILNEDTLVQRAYKFGDANASFTTEVVAGTIREELFHAAYIKALQERWHKSGEDSDNFPAYYRKKTEAIAVELAELRDSFKASGQQEKLIALEHAVAASWSLYGHEGVATVDGIFESLKKKSRLQFRFSAELVRQIVELNRDGSLTSETRYLSVMGKLYDGLKSALTALRAAWSRIRKGDLSAPLLRQAVMETEIVLNQIEEDHSALLKPFDLSEKERSLLNR